jgi:nicotinate phosphoribosyltransferase
VADDAGRRLLADLMLDGTAVAEHVGPDGVAAARAHHAAAIAELPVAAFALSRGEPVLPTRYL